MDTHLTPEQSFTHPVSLNTLHAINKAGLREFYNLLISQGSAGIEPALALLRKELLMQFEELRREVNETREVMAAAITFINGLRAELQKVAGDPTAVQGLINDLDLASTDLARAIANSPTNVVIDTSNTPQETPVPTPVAPVAEVPPVEPTPTDVPL